MPFKVFIALAAALAAAVLAGAERTASACSFGCSKGRALPVAQSAVPANLPGFPLITRMMQFGGGGGDAGGAPNQVELFDPSGVAIPVTLRSLPNVGGLIVPDGPLVPGEHRLVTYPDCDGPGVSTPFIVKEPARLPTSLGDVEITTAPNAITVSPGLAGACESIIQGIRASFSAVPSEELKPWLPIVQWELIVDGVSHGTRFELATLHSVCGQDAKTHSYLTAGKHAVRIVAHVGELAAPFVEKEIDLTCIAPTQTAQPPAAINPEAPSSDGGCSSAHRSDHSFAALLSLFISACVIRRRGRACASSPS